MKTQLESFFRDNVVTSILVYIAMLLSSAGSILDISKYRDTCERSISILDGIAILRYIEYRMIRRYLDDISYDPRYRPIRYLNNRRYGSIARKPRYRDSYYW